MIQAKGHFCRSGLVALMTHTVDDDHGGRRDELRAELGWR